ncbi:MAG: glycosyltransferase family 2 protein [Oligoflexia bacterium]|nr:glycosyltransferase family 2 protein [Oligoflexia bacterium]MBF0365691.1 glycosyltransferase family 2 protein [Oligoflexia bacterium]
MSKSKNQEAIFFSIIIPCYNSQKSIIGTLESCLKQSFPEKFFEVIVVNDGSTDASEQLLLSWIAKNKCEHFFYYYQRNAGPSRARNLGIQLARGKFVAFLDADDHFHPDKLQLIYNFYKRYPQIGIYAHNAIDGAYILYAPFTSALLLSPQEMLPLLLERNILATSTMVIRKELLHPTTAFNEKYRHCEDYELWFKLCKEHSLLILPHVLTYANSTSEGLSGNEIAMYKRAKALVFAHSDLVVDAKLRRRILWRAVREHLKMVLGYRRRRHDWLKRDNVFYLIEYFWLTIVTKIFPLKRKREYQHLFYQGLQNR